MELENTLMMMDYIGICAAILVSSLATILIPYAITRAVIAYKFGTKKYKSKSIITTTAIMLACLVIPVFINFFIGEMIEDHIVNLFVILIIPLALSSLYCHSKYKCFKEEEMRRIYEEEN